MRMRSKACSERLNVPKRYGLRGHLFTGDKETTD